MEACCDSTYHFFLNSRLNQGNILFLLSSIVCLTQIWIKCEMEEHLPNHVSLYCNNHPHYNMRGRLVSNSEMI